MDKPVALDMVAEATEIARMLQGLIARCAAN
jgi:hypothetical protein